MQETSTHQMEDNTSANCCNLNAYSTSSTEAESAVADFAAPIETPDLRNWFSSYAYQSPDLTSSYCCEDSFPIEGESTKDTGLYVEDSEGEEEHTRTDRARLRSNYPTIFVKKLGGVDGCSLGAFSDELDQQLKVPENSDSLPSEPPDIRNWFSSYVYESPTLDTAEIGCSLPTTIDNGGTEDDFTQKERTCISTPMKTSADFLADKSIQTDAVVKRRKLIGCLKSETDSAQQENGNEDQRNDLPSEAKKNSIPGGMSCCAEAAEDEIRDANPVEVHMNPRLKDDSNMNSATKIEFTGKVCSDEAAESEDKASDIDSGRDPGWVLPNRRSKQGNSGSNSRGVSQYKLPEDDGSTSKAKMSANANASANEKKHKGAENVVSGEADKGIMMATRKPLMEISNVCSSGSNEIAGKWRCPQKTKPCIGPHLKQLRLEKWIHRL